MVSRIRYTPAMGTAASLIREARQRAGISQAELARRSGVPRTNVNAYERGRREPGVEILDRLLEAAGLRLAAVRPPRYPDPRAAGRDLEDLLGLVDAIEVERPRRPLRFPGFPQR